MYSKVWNGHWLNRLRARCDSSSLQRTTITTTTHFGQTWWSSWWATSLHFVFCFVCTYLLIKTNDITLFPCEYILTCVSGIPNERRSRILQVKVSLHWIDVYRLLSHDLLPLTKFYETNWLTITTLLLWVGLL